MSYFFQNFCVFRVIFASRKKKKPWLTNPTWQVCPPVKHVFFFHGLTYKSYHNASQKVSPRPQTETVIFKLYFINSLTLLGVKFQNAYLDTSCATIGKKVQTAAPMNRCTPDSESCTSSRNQVPVNHSRHLFDHQFMFPLLLTSVRWAVRDHEG